MKKVTRRTFLAQAAAAAALAARGDGKEGFLWAYMPQFGMNMWGDLDIPPTRDGIMTKHLTDAEFAALCRPENQTHDAVRFDEAVWRDLSARLRASGCGLLLLDLGEFVVYPSHPELAVKGSWRVERLQAEIRRLRDMGFEVVPKLNFSCCHDAWLKDYARMVSTRTYYSVAADLIRDVSEIFETPRFIHLGLDEEDIVEYQTRNTSLVRLRQGDLWWHDALFLIGEVEKRGSRAWVWSDYQRRHTLDEFLREMPKTVLQSPWTYRTETPSFDDPLIKIYQTLATNGYDVIPCASNCYGLKANFTATAAFCRANLPPERYKGMLFAPWMATIPPWQRLLREGAEIFGKAVRENA